MVCDPDPGAAAVPVVPHTAIETAVNSDTHHGRMLQRLRPVPPDVDQVRHRLALSATPGRP